MSVPPRKITAEDEAARWADTMRTALTMARARRDGRRADYWRLFDGIGMDLAPLLIQCMADLAGVGRDDDWFESRLRTLGEAEASGELLRGVREWMAEWGITDG
jgi:hypothetical protein